jgi:hypothetical protein
MWFGDPSKFRELTDLTQEAIAYFIIFKNMH